MAVTKIVNIKVESDQAIEELQEVQKQTESIDESTTQLTGTLDKMTGGAVGSFKKMTGGLKVVTMGFRTLRGAIIATGLGALVVVVGSLIAAFTASEEGANKLSKIMNVLGIVTDKIRDVFADLGEKIIWAFENPQEAISKLADLIRDNVTNRIEGLINLLPELGRAISLVFRGQWSEAGEVAANAIGRVALGVDDVVDKTRMAAIGMKEYQEEVAAAMQKMAEISDMRAQADRIDRELIKQRAEADRNISDLRAKSARRDLYNAEERKQFLIEASELSEEITNKELKAAQLRRDAIVEENKLAKSGKEDKDAEAQAEANVINLQTQKLNLQRRLGAELSSINQQLNAEQAARTKAAEEEAAAQREVLETLRQRWAEEAEKQAQKDLEDEIAFIEELEQEENRYFDDKLSKEDQEIRAVEEKYFRLIELAQQYGQDTAILEDARQEALLAIDRKYSEERMRLADKEALDQQRIEERKQQARIATAQMGLDHLAMIAEEGSNFAKGVAVAQATMSTYEAAIAAYAAGSAVGGPAGLVMGPLAAALAVAAGLANIKNILSVDTTGGGSTSAAPSGGAAATPQAPAFNVVGNSGASRIADTLSRGDEPIRAYVTSGEMTTQQELDRNIRSEATIG